MLRSINTGKHYEKWFPFWTRLFFTQTVWECIVYFHKNCEYAFSAEVQARYDHLADCNKLFGVSLGLLNDNHQDSARWAWRWSKTNQAIELPAYTYADGVKQWDDQMRFPVVDTIPLETYIGLRLIRARSGWLFETYECNVPSGQRRTEHKAKVTIDYDRFRKGFFTDSGKVYEKPAAGYTQGLYFGGQESAPHQIDVSLLLL